MGKRKGRRRKAAPALPSLPTLPPTGSRKARRARAALDESFDLQAAIAALGPCPIVPLTPFEHDLRATFDRDVRRAVMNLPALLQGPALEPQLEAEIERWQRHHAAKALPDKEQRAIIARERNLAEVAARKQWLAKRDELVTRDREMRRKREGMGMIDVDKDPKTGLPVARFGNDRGTAERGRHDALEAVTVANTDKRSQPVTVMRASNTLARLLKSQTINPREFRVAQRFQADYSIGLFDRYPTMKFERLGGGDGDAGAAIVQARQQIGQALKLLGGEGSDQGSIMQRVVGEGMTLADWVTLRRCVVSRRLNTDMAAGLLCGALSILHPFYFPVTHREREEEQLTADADGLSERSGRATGAPPFEQRLAEWQRGAALREKVS